MDKIEGGYVGNDNFMKLSKCDGCFFYNEETKSNYYDAVFKGLEKSGIKMSNISIDIKTVFSEEKIKELAELANNALKNKSRHNRFNPVERNNCDIDVKSSNLFCGSNVNLYCVILIPFLWEIFI